MLVTFKGVRWHVLAIGFVLVVLSSLSVHVVMLQVLNVPYPASLPRQGWAALPDRLLSIFGAATLSAMLPLPTQTRPVWQRAGLLFVLVAMVHESLVRLPVMNILTASRWTLWPFLDAVPTYLVMAAAAAAIVASRRFLTTWGRRTVATLLIGVPIYMVLAPMLKIVFAGVTAWTSSREGYTFYNPPYDWHVELPAYITFVEPVLAAFAVAALVSEQLPRSRLRAWMILALLLFALRGHFFSTFINIGYAGTDAITAMLSFGQFTLESLLLALLTAATWVLAAPTFIGSSLRQRRELRDKQSLLLG